MIEFAMVLALLLMALLGAVDASLWGLGGMAAAIGAADGVRIATDSTTGNPNTLALSAGALAAAKLVQPGVPGTHVVVVAGCPPIATVPGGTLDVCAQNVGGGFVEVGVIGSLAAIIPPPFGFGTHNGIPINVVVYGHSGAFAQ